MGEGNTAKKTLLDLPFLKKIKGIKNIEIIIALVLGAVILLIYFSSFNTNKTASVANVNYTTTQNYTANLEARLSDTLSAINGAGQVNVMVTLENGPELIIATSKDQKTNTTTSGDNRTESITVVENPIIVSANGTSSPLILMEILPKVKGVIVVSEGANNVRVKLDLLNAIEALLNVAGENVQIFAG